MPLLERILSEEEQEFVGNLKNVVNCKVLGHGDEGYLEHCIIWNYFIQKQPLAIAFCENEAQVIATLKLCLNFDIEFSIRSG